MELVQVKQAILYKSMVKHQDVNYYITACIMRLINNAWYYQLELHDLNANAVVIANMEMVELCQDERDKLF